HETHFSNSIFQIFVTDTKKKAHFGAKNAPDTFFYMCRFLPFIVFSSPIQRTHLLVNFDDLEHLRDSMDWRSCSYRNSARLPLSSSRWNGCLRCNLRIKFSQP
ncbi:hypothetical protein LINPERHAP2_LOCUS15427, partial [Linum perenne]